MMQNLCLSSQELVILLTMIEALSEMA